MDALRRQRQPSLRPNTLMYAREYVQIVYGRAAATAALEQFRAERVFALDGTVIKSQEDFVRECSCVLPLDPPLGPGLRWDAFSDSLWSGIDELRVSKVAIVWYRADVLAVADPNVYAEAQRCFQEVGALAEDPKSGIELPTTLKLIGVHGES